MISKGKEKSGVAQWGLTLTKVQAFQKLSHMTHQTQNEHI